MKLKNLSLLFVAAFLPAVRLNSADSFRFTKVTDKSLALFEGDNLEATVQTPEGEPVQGRRSMITVARPLCDTSEATLAVHSRERLANDPGTTIDGVMETNGDVSIMASGRYHRAQVVIPSGADWTYIQGVDFEAVDDGAI